MLSCIWENFAFVWLIFCLLRSSWSYQLCFLFSTRFFVVVRIFCCDLFMIHLRFFEEPIRAHQPSHSPLARHKLLPPTKKKASLDAVDQMKQVGCWGFIRYQLYYTHQQAVVPTRRLNVLLSHYTWVQHLSPSFSLELTSSSDSCPLTSHFRSYCVILCCCISCALALSGNSVHLIIQVAECGSLSAFAMHYGMQHVFWLVWL